MVGYIIKDKETGIHLSRGFGIAMEHEINYWTQKGFDPIIESVDIELIRCTSQEKSTLRKALNLLTDSEQDNVDRSVLFAKLEDD